MRAHIEEDATHQRVIRAVAGLRDENDIVLGIALEGFASGEIDGDGLAEEVIESSGT